MALPLIEKYRVKNLSDIKGQNLVIQDTKTFLKTFPKKAALVLNGPVGTGKTSIAYALAKENNLEIFELNASDLRNRAKLEEILKPAIGQKSLFKKGKLILMDEADGITTSDNGGLPELLVLIDKTSFPIILTANDIWQKKFNLLRKKCQIINVKEVKEEIVIEVINNVLKNENRQLKSEVIKLIAEKSRGDIRAVLNDLQGVLSMGEDAYMSEISEREKEESIFNALKKVFQNTTDENIIKVYDATKFELNEISLWVEENIPLEYQGKALAKAYDSLSKADLFKGRIYRQQYWRFLIYQNFFLSAGISAATKLKNKIFVDYKRPSKILKIWLSNQKTVNKKTVIAKYAKFCHMSKKKAMKEFFLLPLILDEEAQKKLDFDEKEQEYMQNKKGDLIIVNNLNKFRI